MLAAGTCTLTWNGNDYTLERPELFRAEAMKAYPLLVKPFIIVPGTQQFMRLHPAKPAETQGRFLFAFGSIRQHFRPRRHLISAPEWRTEMTNRFAVGTRSLPPQRSEVRSKPPSFATQSTHIDRATSIPK